MTAVHLLVTNWVHVLPQFWCPGAYICSRCVSAETSAEQRASGGLLSLWPTEEVRTPRVSTNSETLSEWSGDAASWTEPCSSCVCQRYRKVTKSKFQFEGLLQQGNTFTRSAWNSYKMLETLTKVKKKITYKNKHEEWNKRRQSAVRERRERNLKRKRPLGAESSWPGHGSYAAAGHVDEGRGRRSGL